MNPEPTAWRDEFLSEEDLDLGNLTVEELAAYWDLWFRQAQATNEADRWTYTHGVFEEVPERART